MNRRLVIFASVLAFCGTAATAWAATTGSVDLQADEVAIDATHTFGITVPGSTSGKTGVHVKGTLYFWNGNAGNLQLAAQDLGYTQAARVNANSSVGIAHTTWDPSRNSITKFRAKVCHERLGLDKCSAKTYIR